MILKIKLLKPSGARKESVINAARHQVLCTPHRMQVRANRDGITSNKHNKIKPGATVETPAMSTCGNQRNTLAARGKAGNKYTRYRCHNTPRITNTPATTDISMPASNERSPYASNPSEPMERKKVKLRALNRSHIITPNAKRSDAMANRQFS